MARTWWVLAWLILGCKARKTEPEPWIGDSAVSDDDDDTDRVTDSTGGTDQTDTARPDPYDGPHPLTPADRVWVAAERLDEAGRALDVGDADDDGLAEVLIGTPSTFVYGPDADVAHSGAYVVEASSPSGVIDDVAIAEMHGDPDRNGDYFGSCTAIVGDVSGDGISDVQLCGTTMEGVVGAGNPVFQGPHQGLRFAADGWAEVTVHRDTPHPPGRVEPCGDVNGDGLADVCMEAGATVVPAPPDRGVYVLFGPLDPGPNAIETTYDALMLSDVAEVAGQNMAGGADLTGDGVNDLLVGADERDGGRGGAYLVSDITPGVHDLASWPLWTGTDPYEQAGLGLAVGGDLDGDGRGDAFIGAHIWDGRRGRGFVVNDLVGGPLPDAFLTLEGANTRDWYGADAAIGDFDGDGQSDLAVGVPRDIYFGFDRPGRVALYYGPLAAGTRSDADADRMLRGSDFPDAFGFTLDAGDTDGDGRDDLAIGAPFDETAGPAAGAVHLYFGAGLSP